MEYTLVIYKFDKRTKAGYRAVGTYHFDRKDDDAMQREVRELQHLYPTHSYTMRFNPTYTTVKNLMSGADVQIRTEDRGGPCDPSTERYWSM